MLNSWNRRSYVRAGRSYSPVSNGCEAVADQEEPPVEAADLEQYSLSRNHGFLSTMPGAPCSAIVSSIIPANLAKDVEKKACFSDEFGFRTDPNDARMKRGNAEQRIFFEDSRLRLKWIAYFEFTFNKVVEDLTWEKVESFLPKSDQLSELVRQGVPHSLRPYVWPRLCGAMCKRKQVDFSYKEVLKAVEEEDKFVFKQIEKDLTRTLPNNVCFSQLDTIGIERLRRVLRAMSFVFPDIGYCQGMGVIVAILLLFLEEESAFWMMFTIVEDLLPQQYYSDPLLGAVTDQRVFRALISKLLPKVDAVLTHHDIEPSLITLHWFMTIYSSNLPFQVLLRVWDLFFYEGSAVLFRVALALLKLKENNLRVLSNSAEVFNLLSELPSLFPEAELILSAMDEFRSSVVDETLSCLRSKQSAYVLVNESNGQLVNVGTSGRRQRGHDRLLRRSQSLSGTSRTRNISQSSSVFAADEELKNIKQTELMLQLKEAVQLVAKNMMENNPDSYSEIDLQADYSLQSHEVDYERYMVAHRYSRRLARALVDFERRDEDDLGFKKNDLVTVISRKDEHCWIGELNGMRGWFPAKFVEFLNEQLKDYFAFPDDSQLERVEMVVRQRLCAALKGIFGYGIKKSSILGRRFHPWMFFESVSAEESAKGAFAVQNKVMLCQTFQLDEDGRILSPEELLHKALQYINTTHDAAKVSMDVKFRSLICLALNEQVLHLWFELLCSCEEVVSKWYHSWSFIRSPGWVQVKCELRILAQFVFRLSTAWELPGSQKRFGDQPIRENVRDMLVKHHLFSWDT